MSKEEAEGTNSSAVGRRIPEEALEVLSDVFLASHSRDKEYPAYSEQLLGRKCRKVQEFEAHFSQLSAADHEEAFTPEHSDTVCLSNMEKEAYVLFCDGHKLSAIARRLGVSRPTARRLVKTAFHRIKALQGPFATFYEVYQTEVHKRIYRDPKHCRAEPCRDLGYCKYATLRYDLSRRFSDERLDLIIPGD